MGRVLAIDERRVDAAMRTAYLASLAARREAATHAGAHFWVFEHADEHGRFIEFTEGSDSTAVRALGADGARRGLWREVQGG